MEIQESIHATVFKKFESWNPENKKIEKLRFYDKYYFNPKKYGLCGNPKLTPETTPQNLFHRIQGATTLENVDSMDSMELVNLFVA